MRVLIRVAYGLAPILVFGAMAMSTSGGKHRLMVLALGVLIGVVLFVSPDGAGLRNRFDRFSRRPATPAGDAEVAIPAPREVPVPAAES